VLTGLREYLQIELALSDRDLILVPPVASRKEKFDVSGVPGLYGIVEYSPDAPNLAPKLSGPFCAWHEKEPKPARTDAATGKSSLWKHVTTEPNNKTVEVVCELQTNLTIGELERAFRESAKRVIDQGSAVRAARAE
jgi:hypothetical protein